MYNTCRFLLILLITALLVSITGPGVHAQNLEDINLLKGAFDNVSGGKACLLYSGNVNDIDSAPANNDRTILLMQSSIGWTTPESIGWVRSEAAPGEAKTAAEDMEKRGDDFITSVKEIFNNFYSNPDDENKDPDQIYLAYDFELTNGKLVDPDTGEEIDNIAASYDQDKADEAKENFYRALQILNSDDLKSKILDIPYYKSSSLILHGNLCLEKAFNVRFQEFSNKDNAIEDELKFLGWKYQDHSGFSDSKDGAWYNFNEASKIWFTLFASPIQRQFLVDLAPRRTLTQVGNPNYETEDRPTDWEGDWPPVIYDGYKDVAIMLRALTQRAKVINEVAKRLVLINKRSEASELVETYYQQFAIEESVILSIVFEHGKIPGADHDELYPGLAESFFKYREMLSSLSITRDSANDPHLNALGFDKNIIPILPGSVGGGIDSTYDYRMTKTLNNQNSPLEKLFISDKQDQEAKNVKVTYKLKLIDFIDNVNSINNQYKTELISITGNDNENLEEPELDNPESGGGLLEQQIENVKLAENNIQRVLRQMENVHTRIDIEKNRVEEVNKELGARADMVIKFGNKEATLTQQMANIQANMAFASGMASATSTALTGGISNLWGGGGLAGAVQAANAVYQRKMHRKLGEKQAAIVMLRAEKEAQFIYSDTRINDINSQASIQTWFLELRTLDIDLLDAQIRLGQELNRLSQYYNDIETLLVRMGRKKRIVAQKHFADPTYRIEVLDAVLKAEELFRKAQADVFITARSLAYKYPLSPSPLNEYRSIVNDIIRARTAENLISCAVKMQDFNSIHEYESGKQSFYWNFSLRKEYLSFKESVELPGGETISAVERFQRYLSDLTNNANNLVDLDNNGTPDHLSISFSTVNFDLSGSDTVALDLRDSDGTTENMQGKPIFDARLWDDKIDLVHVNIIGNGVYSDPQIMPVQLLYGGTGFIRTEESDSVNDPDLQQDVDIDFISYPNMNWTIDNRNGGFGWKNKEYRPQAMSAKLTANPRDIPADVITTTNFRELPVASTGWRLLIPIEGTNLDAIRDIEIVIIHKARTKPFN